VRVEPGPFRPRPRGLHRPPAAVRDLPARVRLPVARAHVRAAAKAVAVRGVVPAAAGRAPARDLGRRLAARRRGRRRGARLPRARRAGRGLGRLCPAACVAVSTPRAQEAAASLRHPLTLTLLALTLSTGTVDAVSYLALGHVFTANMTGNIVLL